MTPWWPKWNKAPSVYLDSLLSIFEGYLLLFISGISKVLGWTSLFGSTRSYVSIVIAVHSFMDLVFWLQMLTVAMESVHRFSLPPSSMRVCTDDDCSSQLFLKGLEDFFFEYLYWWFSMFCIFFFCPPWMACSRGSRSMALQIVRPLGVETTNERNGRGLMTLSFAMFLVQQWMRPHFQVWSWIARTNTEKPRVLVFKGQLGATIFIHLRIV